MLAAMFADSSLNEVDLQLPGLPQCLRFVLDFFSQLRKFETQQELMHRSQGGRPQGGNLGHHIRQQDGSVVCAHLRKIRIRFVIQR